MEARYPFQEIVEALRKRGMYGKAAYQDSLETMNQSLLHECWKAVPVSPLWIPPKRGRGKPRGLSVNEGSKYAFLD